MGLAKPEAYRYLHEALEVTFSRVPSLHKVLADQEKAGELILRLDATLITGKVTSRDDDGASMIGWFSGKHYCFGGNLQVLSNREGRPLYIVPVEPGPHAMSPPRESTSLVLCGRPSCGFSLT